MRALIKSSSGPVVADVPDPRIEHADDVIVEVEWAGICRTDIYTAYGKLQVDEGRILGHEASGTVAATGSATDFEIGDRVAIMPWLACSSCPTCERGRPQRCPHGTMLGVDCDGAFADRVRAPARSVFRIADSLPFRRAAYAEPLFAAMAVLDIDLPRRGRGLIAGGNRIAELLHRVLRVSGFTDIDIWTDERVPPPGGDYDFAVESRATTKTLDGLFEALRPGATLVIKSRPSQPVAVSLGRAVQRELTLRAVHYGSFDRALSWLDQPPAGFAVDDLFGASFPLEAFADAFAEAERERHKCFFTPGSKATGGA